VEVEVFHRRRHDSGLITAIVDGIGIVPWLAHALDPAAPYVLLKGYAPFDGGFGSWRQVRLPLSPRQALQPTEVLARRVTYDTVIATTTFLNIAPDLAEHGIDLLQLRRAPDDQARFDNQHPVGRAAVLRKFGLVVGIELPMHRCSAQFTALSDAELDQALDRLRAIPKP
jgi:hypothetical protein